jgi:hypothetical protein
MTLKFEIIISDSGIRYYRNGKEHNINKPAIMTIHGDTFWYQYGRRHRDDGPAIVFKAGTTRWYNHGKSHGSFN